MTGNSANSGVPRVPAVRNALAVLRLLSENARPLQASVIARDLSMPRSSVYQLLAVLCDEGVVIRIPESRGYTLGEGLFSMAASPNRRRVLKNLATPPMDDLVAATGETAQLSVLAGNQSICVLKLQPSRPMLLVTDPGVGLPAHLCASGRSMLACLSRHEVFAAFSVEGSFELRTGAGPRTLRDLNRRLTEERIRGWSVEFGWVSDGVCCLAAPILDSQGRQAAGVSLSFRGDAYDLEAVAELLSRVCRCADRITERLGGHPPHHVLAPEEAIVELQRLLAEQQREQRGVACERGTGESEISDGMRAQARSGIDAPDGIDL